MAIKAVPAAIQESTNIVNMGVDLKSKRPRGKSTDVKRYVNLSSNYLDRTLVRDCN